LKNKQKPRYTRPNTSAGKTPQRRPEKNGKKRSKRWSICGAAWGGKGLGKMNARLDFHQVWGIHKPGRGIISEGTAPDPQQWKWGNEWFDTESINRQDENLHKR